MKKLILSALIISLVFLSACQLRENYAVQYGFSNEVITETAFQPTTDGVDLEIPFPDFSCDVKSFKAVLDRQENTFVLTIEGTETTERCHQKFEAEITGVQPGTYWLAVLYKKGEEQLQVLYEEFTISKL